MKKRKILFFAEAILSVASGTITAKASSVTIPSTSITSLSKAPSASEFAGFFSGLKTIGTAVSGICTITALIFFIINLTRLSTSVGNDIQRARALKGILYSGASLALFGGITVIVSIFWNAV